MLPAKQLLNEVINSLRNVIAPAVADPYPKSQAYMAAVILEFVSRQVEECGAVGARKQHILESLFQDLGRIGSSRLTEGTPIDEAGLCAVIERLYANRASLGEEAFSAASAMVRRALRDLLDDDLKIAKGEG